MTPDAASRESKDYFLSRVKPLSAVANRFSGVDWIRCAFCPTTEGDAMTTDLTSQGDLITELHLESLFNSGATHAEPEVHFPKRDAVRLRHRLANLGGKLGRDALVRIDNENPLVPPRNILE